MKRMIIEEEYIMGLSEFYEFDNYGGVSCTKSKKYFIEPYTTDERFEELKKKTIEEYEKNESLNSYWEYPQFMKYWKETDRKILSEI